MAACEMLTGSAGWPLTVIMTPDRKPFFAATYLPKHTRAGRLGMLELIPKIEQIWTTNPDQLSKNGNQVSALLSRELNRIEPGQDLSAAVLKQTAAKLSSDFDARDGGFGSAPKFPPSMDLLLLLRCWKRTEDRQALAMVEKTLDAMRGGGVYDQVGFGFHRYSVDAAWRVPHFEKMLYDQALLAMAYTEAYQATHLERYERTAREIFAYVLRDLTSPEGAFYDAQDADSEGREGKFYLWTEQQIRQTVPGSNAEFALKVFDIRAEGNLAAGEPDENVLYLRAPLDEIASELKMSEGELEQRLELVRRKLFAARAKRVHPRKDDKILVAWNGLMIAALAKGAQAFGDMRYADAAGRAAGFILKNMRASDGRLFHSHVRGRASRPGNLDDYACLIWGLVELYQADFRLAHLQAALDLNRDVVRHFWDDKDGAFFFTADYDHDQLLRQKPFADVDLPAGNSLVALNLMRLGEMTGNDAFEEKADRVLRAFSGVIQKAPSQYPTMLAAADFALGPTYEVVIAGDSRATDTKAMLRAVTASFVPDKVVLLRSSEEASPAIVRLAGYTRYQSPIDGKATAYVCVKYNCKLPTTEIRKMLELLGTKAK